MSGEKLRAFTLRLLKVCMTLIEWASSNGSPVEFLMNPKFEYDIILSAVILSSEEGSAPAWIQGLHFNLI